MKPIRTSHKTARFEFIWAFGMEDTNSLFDKLPLLQDVQASCCSLLRHKTSPTCRNVLTHSGGQCFSDKLSRVLRTSPSLSGEGSVSKATAQSFVMMRRLWRVRHWPTLNMLEDPERRPPTSIIEIPREMTEHWPVEDFALDTDKFARGPSGMTSELASHEFCAQSDEAFWQCLCRIRHRIFVTHRLPACQWFLEGHHLDQTFTLFVQLGICQWCIIGTLWWLQRWWRADSVSRGSGGGQAGLGSHSIRISSAACLTIQARTRRV